MFRNYPLTMETKVILCTCLLFAQGDLGDGIVCKKQIT